MRDPVGMNVQVVRAEQSRFRHPLLLLHGFWTGAWIWRDFAPYLGHRGWDAWMPSFLEGDEPADLDARRRLVAAIRDAMPLPPVILAHDVGAAVAIALADELAAPAVVALAPVTSVVVRGRRGAWGSPRFWGPRIFATRLAAPRGRTARLVRDGLTDADLALLRPDSGSLFRALLSGTLESSGQALVPGLVLGSASDGAVPLAACHRLADARRWTVASHETSGHFPMLGAGAASLADTVHRWLVRTIGEPLLAWIDGDEEADE